MRKEEIEELAGLLQHSSVKKLEIAGDGWALRLDREVPKPKDNLEAEATPVPGLQAPVPKPDHTPSQTVVDAPMVGVFHHNRPPVALGRPIRAGDVLGQIEALTLLSEVHSPFDGEIVEIRVDDGQPVEYGQPLFVLQGAKG
ncbi:MAG: biotin/lipoyl-binding protein [Armatimonadetes bacterium]|jgi:biotin carboxyl carrier protein|nr:biotin/lipoyl-binding protein [Armatimonadota bacterium]HOC30926.1 acetyl-CoA carboxylase biotin carboxyl carrier protein subunit [Armatimonadota bacterium]